MPKSIGSAIVGKLLPALIRLYGRKVCGGVNMNKVHHIINKAQHGFDKLNPIDIVYEVVKVTKVVGPLQYVQITLITLEIIECVVCVSTGGVARLGTAYVIEKIADGLDKL